MMSINSLALRTDDDVLNCPDRDSKVSMLLSIYGNLEGIYDYLVRVIDKLAKQKTTRANSVLSNEVICYKSGQLIRKSSSKEIILELNREEWLRVFAYDRTAINAYAIYLPIDGKIYLLKDFWCLNNFIHETLHSTSVFSKKNGPHRNLRFVYEGITELVTGLVLRSEFHVCFGEWTKIEKCFLKAYKTWIKIWNYFLVKIGSEDVLNIYFNCNLQNPYSKIIELMAKKGYNIRNVFSNYNPYENIESRFLNELAEVFGSDFVEYVSSDILCIEPGRI